MHKALMEVLLLYLPKTDDDIPARRRSLACQKDQARKIQFVHRDRRRLHHREIPLEPDDILWESCRKPPKKKKSGGKRKKTREEEEQFSLLTMTLIGGGMEEGAKSVCVSDGGGSYTQPRNRFRHHHKYVEQQQHFPFLKGISVQTNLLPPPPQSRHQIS